MNGPPIPPLAIDPRQLHTRRCARHPAREAAARCPGCAEFFCRECIVEHEGKLLCARCLARVTAARERRRQRLASLRRAVSAGAGTLVLWLVFYWLGALLLKIPPDFHDGTIWKKAVE
jgi:uncharacterized paraquat-inducible protein A